MGTSWFSAGGSAQVASKMVTLLELAQVHPPTRFEVEQSAADVVSSRRVASVAWGTGTKDGLHRLSGMHLGVSRRGA